MAFQGYGCRWYGPQVARRIEAAAFRGLRKAAAHARRRIVQRISLSASVGRGAVSPTPGGRPPRRYQPSRPGEPPRARTGKLRQSIFDSADRGAMAATVGTKLKYGVYLERGTGPSLIEPRRKRALVFGGWVSSAGGMKWGWVFTGRVYHPGIRPRPYIRTTIEQERARLFRIIVDEIRLSM